MGLWEFLACAGGFNEFHGGKSDKSSSSGGDRLSDEQLREMGIEGF
ncbi:hypothetical protein [Pseudovibrio ascidiaceicola]|nr:hypothetical protein [Pseudovibrio ascidiaceicola]